jgi:hypothetical protein
LAERREEGGMSEEPTERAPVGPVELPCGEPGCTETIVYQRQELPGIAYDRIGTGTAGQPPTRTRTVYLECAAGHVRAYRLPIPRPDHE